MVAPQNSSFSFAMAQTSPSHSSRRRFLRTTLAGGAALALPTYLRAEGANDDVRIAVIGVGGRGNGHLQQYSRAKGCRVAAICDCDSKFNDQRKAALEKDGIKVKTYVDYRKLLEDPEIDAISIATPNHTHALIAIEGLKAGKHVFVEKPVSHNIWEGRQLVEASRKYGKICMHGMQRRSSEGWMQCMEWIRAKDNPLGPMTLSRGLCYKTRKSIGKVDGPQQPPASVDYNLWSGPREMLPIHRQQFHYDWHWQWPWGNGDIGNQGPHQFDVARWALGDPDQCPPSVICIGGRFGYEDDGQTPNTQIAFFDFKPVPMIFEVRGLPDSGMDWGVRPVYKPLESVNQGTDIGNVIHLEGGAIIEGQVYANDGKRIERFRAGESGDHCQNFINHIKAGKLPHIHDALTGHLSAALPHMANVSYRLGQTTQPGEIQERLKGNAQFLETFERMKEHLGANGITFDASQITLGPMLSFDPAAEKFTGEMADRANDLAADHYREEFAIKI